MKSDLKMLLEKTNDTAFIGNHLKRPDNIKQILPNNGIEEFYNCLIDLKEYYENSCIKKLFSDKLSRIEWLIGGLSTTILNEFNNLDETNKIQFVKYSLENIDRIKFYNFAHKENLKEVMSKTICFPNNIPYLGAGYNGDKIQIYSEEIKKNLGEAATNLTAIGLKVEDYAFRNSKYCKGIFDNIGEYAGFGSLNLELISLKNAKNNFLMHSHNSIGFVFNKIGDYPMKNSENSILYYSGKKIDLNNPFNKSNSGFLFIKNENLSEKSVEELIAMYNLSGNIKLRIIN